MIQSDTQRKWLVIAKAYATPADQRTEEQGYVTRDGLCHAALRSRLPDNERWALLTAVHKDCGFCYLYFENTPTIEQDEGRALLATLFAAMTDLERLDALSSP
jgi:hypothetical protein